PDHANQPQPESEICYPHYILSPTYSWRSTTRGSTLAARRAGIQHASKATLNSNNGIRAKLNGSGGGISKSRLLNNRVNPQAPASPNSTPDKASPSPCRKISVSTWPGCAPSVNRTPIS